MTKKQPENTQSGTSETTEGPKGLAIPLEYHMPDHIVPLFTTNMVIQYMGDTFKISFYDLREPLWFKPEDSKAEEAKPPHERTPARAVCVTSIVVTPDKLRTWLKVMQTHVNRFYKSDSEDKEKKSSAS